MPFMHIPLMLIRSGRGVAMRRSRVGPVGSSCAATRRQVLGFGILGARRGSGQAASGRVHAMNTAGR